MDRPIYSTSHVGGYYNAEQKDIHDAEWYVKTNMTLYEGKKIVYDYRALNASVKEFSMSNIGNYTEYYNVNIKKVKARFYIGDGIVKGTFDNVFFGAKTFWDHSTFKDCSFINCHFDKISIRRCVFDKCQFVGCTGTIHYIRESKFNNCSFSSDIEIEQVDKYFMVNQEKYKDGYIYMKLCE